MIMCLLNLTSLRHHFLFRVWHTSDKRERFPFFIFASFTSHSNLFNPWFCSESFDFEVNRNDTFNFQPQIDHFYAILPYQRFHQFSKSCHRSTIGCCCFVSVFFQAIFTQTKFRMVLEFFRGVIFKKFAREDSHLPGRCFIGESDTP